MGQQWLKLPNLPRGNVCLCIADCRNEKLRHNLEDFGATCLCPEPSRQLNTPVAQHSDMLALHLGDSRFLVSSDQHSLYTELQKRGATVKKVLLQGYGYPFEAALNVACIGEIVLHNPKTIDSNAKEFFKKQNRRVWAVKQGYTKCSTTVVAENAIITEDPGIAAQGRHIGMDVLQIPYGYVQLPGYNYGFLGGCCGLLRADCLAFTGDISLHPSYQEIQSFLRCHKVEPVCLTNGPLIDIGGILPLQEIIR